MLRYEIPTGDKHRYTVEKVLAERSRRSFFLSSGAFTQIFLPSTRLTLCAMASWSPQPAGLQEILQTIRDSTDTQNKVQRTITHVRLGPVFIPISSCSPHFYIETQYLHACTRLRSISGPYLGYLATGGGPDSDNCWIPTQE